MVLPQFYVDDLIKRAVIEDINYVDVTTDYLVDENDRTSAKLIAKDEGILAGIDVALRVFTLLDADTAFEILKHDGDSVVKGDVIARISGKTRVLLKANVRH